MFITNPDGAQRLGDYLKAALTEEHWTHCYGAVAFVRASGVQQLAPEMTAFQNRNGVLRLVVGIDLFGSSEEGLRLLVENLVGPSYVAVLHNENDSTFHPKVWLFANAEKADLFVGSGNLTGGGLFTNYEIAVRLSLDLSVEEDRATYDAALDVLARWSEPDENLVKRLDVDLLKELVQGGYVLPERLLREQARERRKSPSVVREAQPRLFGTVRVPPAPALLRPVGRTSSPVGSVAYPTSATNGRVGFVMTLTQTDVGVGQTTEGTSRRSPEVFVPLAARDYRPDFWGWLNLFVEDPTYRGKYDRSDVRVRIGGDVALVNMWNWPPKHDFRLRSESLRSAGDVGDILRLEKLEDNPAFDYYAEVIPQGTAHFAQYLALCTNAVRNSSKRWGYYASGPSEA
ncbi:MAG: hypothetical protein HEQ38_05665 [Gemmatimonas sp.]|nr:hypothetical protein [Gemmatimonas sp.]